MSPKAGVNRFDRVRPRTGDAPLPGPNSVDNEGKRALFSTVPPAASAGAVTIDCSSCGEQTVLSFRQALRAAIPSLHLPLLRGEHFSWMRCPACGRRTWVRARIGL